MFFYGLNLFQDGQMTMWLQLNFESVTEMLGIEAYGYAIRFNHWTNNWNLRSQMKPIGIWQVHLDPRFHFLATMISGTKWTDKSKRLRCPWSAGWRCWST